MLNHVSARCASYRLLFPSRNIESITPQQTPVRLLQRPLEAASCGSRLAAGGARLAVDMRLLLGVPNPRAASAIKLEWVSTDQERRAALLVDSVDEILSSPHGHLTPLPHAPRRVKTLCDGVLLGPDGTFQLGIRLDALWPTALFEDRRLWRKALVLLPSDDDAPAIQTEPAAS